MIKKPKLMKKITPGLVIVLVLFILLISIQIVYFDRIPNRKDYSFSMEVSEDRHDYSRTQEIYELFLESKNWEISNYDTNEERIKVNKTEGELEFYMSIKVDNNQTLIITGGSVVSYDTPGPPLHPRTGGNDSYCDECLINETRNVIQNSLRFLDVNVPDEEIGVRRMSFLPVLEELGIHLYYFSYFLLFLIVATISAMSRFSLIPSIKGKNIGILTTGFWYIGIAFNFFFISTTILGFYYDIFTKFYFIPVIIGSLSMAFGYLLNYYTCKENNGREDCGNTS